MGRKLELDIHEYFLFKHMLLHRIVSDNSLMTFLTIFGSITLTCIEPVGCGFIVQSYDGFIVAHQDGYHADVVLYGGIAMVHGVSFPDSKASDLGSFLGQVSDFVYNFFC